MTFLSKNRWQNRVISCLKSLAKEQKANKINKMVINYSLA